MIRLRSTAPAGVVGAWLLSVTFLAGCAAAPQEPACNLAGIGRGEAGAEVPFGQGVLWRVERPDAPPSHVFGTVHSRDPELARLAAPVAAQLDAARSLAVEVVQTPTATQVHRRAIEIQDGDLERLIGSERMKAVERAGARYGLPERRLRKLKPWALSVLFSLPPAEVRSLRPTLDRVLEDSAAARGTPIHGLESIEEQIELYDGLDLDRQLALLDAALAENWRIDCWWEQVIKPAYLRRDAGALYALLTPQAMDGDDFLWRTLIVERNARMVRRMRDRLLEGAALIAVGAAHLPGDLGILNLLAQQGYEVARVY